MIGVQDVPQSGDKVALGCYRYRMDNLNHGIDTYTLELSEPLNSPIYEQRIIEKLVERGRKLAQDHFTGYEMSGDVVATVVDRRVIVTECGHGTKETKTQKVTVEYTVAV